MPSPLAALFSAPVAILDALDEPALLATRNGSVAGMNEAWAARFGEVSGEQAAATLGDNGQVFRLAKAARRGEHHTEILGDVELSVAPLGRHSLWRARPVVSASVPVDTQPATVTRFAADAESGSLDALIAAAPVGVVRLSSGDVTRASVRDANGAFARLVGAILGEATFASLVLSDDRDNLRRLSAPQSEPVVLRFQSGKAAEVWRMDDEAGRAVLMLVDSTSRREMESRMAQGSKMQAIGEIAGGVAHELNNLLTVVTLNADKLLALHPVGDPSYVELSQIQQTTGRAAELVKMLLAYARKQTFRRDVLDVGRVLSELSVLLQQVVDEKVAFDIVHGRDLPAIKADRQQIETVLMNLVTNARDAIVSAGTPNAKILVTTRAVDSSVVRDALRGAGVAEVPDGQWAAIAVADNGTGIPPELVDKIFEPFFTTKEVGKGTGIGLATVYGIIKQSNGFIGIETAQGKGTTFTIFLPAHIPDPAEVTTQAPAPTPPPARPANLAGRGRILLVEDEDGVRTIAAQLLTQRGYQVTEACDGEEALEILEDNPGGFDLMLSDVVMPGMDGPALLKAAGPLLGDARVVFMSGYAERDFAETLDANRSIAFMPKPFTLQQLAERVKQELAGG